MIQYATDEAAIITFAARAAWRARRSLRNIDSLPATEVYDECRDHAYDLLDDMGGDDLVDMLLGDVTDAAVEMVLS